MFAYKLAFDEPVTDQMLTDMIKKMTPMHKLPNGAKFREYLQKVGVFIVMLTEVASVQEWMRGEMAQDYDFWRTQEGEIVKEQK